MSYSYMQGQIKIYKYVMLKKFINMLVIIKRLQELIFSFLGYKVKKRS